MYTLLGISTLFSQHFGLLERLKVGQTLTEECANAQTVCTLDQ